MADSKIRHRDEIIAMESLAMAGTAEDIAAAGGTIPANTGEIAVFCPTADNLHWHPTGTPTATFGHAVTLGTVFRLNAAQHLAKIISDDSSDVTVIIAYYRGSGRADGGGSVAASTPF